MAALISSPVMNEVGVGPLRPAPWGLILLSRKDGHCHRDLDAFDIEEAALVFPIETRGGDPGIGQPVKCNVVEDLVTRQFTCRARGALQRCNYRRRRLAIM